ncbi:MAG: Flp pilus assembly complex ATPase component TadA [Phycisphaerae bacterium]|nr:Flp pilus assembly complex ATPase component TadA [Phycisphaerae bacterium]
MEGLILQSFLPFDLTNTLGLIGWFYLCLYSVRRTHTSTLVEKSYRVPACFAALFVGPFLLVLLFIVDTVQKLNDGSLSGRQLFFYVLDSLIQKERPLVDVVSENSPVPFKVMTFSGLELSELKRGKPQKQAEESEYDWEEDVKPPAFIDLTKEEGVIRHKDVEEEPLGPEAELLDSVETEGDLARDHPTESKPLREWNIQNLLREAIGHRAKGLTVDSVGSECVKVHIHKGQMQRLFLELDRPQGVQLIRDFHLLAEIAAESQTISRVGSFFVEVGDRKYCLRVVSIPALGGYKLSVRIIESMQETDSMDRFGLSDSQVQLVSQTLSGSSGLILVMAPRNNGMVELLYSLLNQPAVKERSRFLLQTFSDKLLDGVTQVEVDWSLGMTFEQTIKAAMLSSAEVICVDRIENAETAKAAVQAAQNGALVIAGIHAESSEEGLVRLMRWDLKLSQFLPDVKLLLAFRQIHRLCRHCRKRASLSDFQREYLNERSLNFRKVYAPGGCKRCDQTGYQGQGWLVETLKVDGTLVRKYTAPECSAETMVCEGRDRFYHFLRRVGMRKALAGITSLEEVKRISSSLE